MVAAAAVILALTGTITAVAAGKITGLFSSTNKMDAITTAKELEEKGSKELGEALLVADTLADGSRFRRAILQKFRLWMTAEIQLEPIRRSAFSMGIIFSV